MKKNGFTLVEVIAIVFILGLLATLSVSTVNKMVMKSKVKVMEANSNSIQKAVIANCKMEKLDKVDLTKLYTIVDKKIDKDIEFSGELPENGYVLLDKSCNVAYSFYDGDYTSSKNFIEDEPLVDSKNSVKTFGLEWRSNSDEDSEGYLDDTYTRTLDASDIADDSVKVQIGDEVVTNAFDELDIYKDILPYTDEFGNEFMLIPKFYISKTKEVTDTEVVWNYAVSKQKLDDTYYLPSNFVDEGEDNNQHIELPYVLVGKYEAGSNGLTGDEEMLVSKPRLDPRVSMNISEARTMATRYNDIEGINGYQQYDIHVQDLLTMLFVIEFKTMNSQNIMNGNVSNSIGEEVSLTGKSDIISSSSGSPSNDGFDSFHYRGIENLWGNVWSFTDGVNIDNIENEIYSSCNSRKYVSTNFKTDYKIIKDYKRTNSDGYISESGFDENSPYINYPIKTNGNSLNGYGDYYYGTPIKEYKIILSGGSNYIEENDGGTILNTYGLNRIAVSKTDSHSSYTTGTRLIKLPFNN